MNAAKIASTASAAATYHEPPVPASMTAESTMAPRKNPHTPARTCHTNLTFGMLDLHDVVVAALTDLDLVVLARQRRALLAGTARSFSVLTARELERAGVLTLAHHLPTKTWWIPGASFCSKNTTISSSPTFTLISLSGTEMHRSSWALIRAVSWFSSSHFVLAWLMAR